MTRETPAGKHPVALVGSCDWGWMTAAPGSLIVHVQAPVESCPTLAVTRLASPGEASYWTHTQQRFACTLATDACAGAAPTSTAASAAAPAMTRFTARPPPPSLRAGS